MRCLPCPVAAGLYCPGEAARRLCDLIDLAHLDHRPGYVATLRSHARQVAEAPAPAALAVDYGVDPKSRPCCG